jgi:hypothetical protein
LADDRAKQGLNTRSLTLGSGAAVILENFSKGFFALCQGIEALVEGFRRANHQATLAA